MAGVNWMVEPASSEMVDFSQLLVQITERPRMP